MIRVLAALLMLTLVGCGIKSDLDLPNGKPPSKDQPDPSRPGPAGSGVQPLGQ